MRLHPDLIEITEPKEFRLGTVMTVLDERMRNFTLLEGEDAMDELLDLLEYMIGGEPVHQMQVERTARMVATSIMQQHPDFVSDPAMQIPDSPKESIKEWVGWLGAYYLYDIPLVPLRKEDITILSAFDEAVMHGKKLPNYPIDLDTLN